MLVFLSHNKEDKAVARKIGAHLILSNIDVWFDEWEIQAGDSIPGKLNEGLANFDAFVLLWSVNAKRSNWVREELQSAIMYVIKNQSAKIVPCLLDDTELPPLISNRSSVDLKDVRKGIEDLLDSLTGQRTQRARLLAIQSALDDMNLECITHPALPPMVCCPNCGGDKKNLLSWQQIDEVRDDVYYGLRCERCGWSNGGEI